MLLWYYEYMYRVKTLYRCT